MERAGYLSIWLSGWPSEPQSKMRWRRMTTRLLALTIVSSSVIGTTSLVARNAITGKFPSLIARHISGGVCRSSQSLTEPFVHKRPPSRFVNKPFNYHEEIEIDIEDISNLGLGIGRAKLPSGDSWVVMVPYVIAGEKVIARIYKNHQSYSEADLVKVLVASKDRVTPPCPYFTSCGGCQYQHMTIEAQRAWKRKQVITSLQRIGKLDISEGIVNDIIGTDHHYGYRTKISPHFNLPAAGSKVKIGFQERSSSFLIDIDQCKIASPAINVQYAKERDRIHSLMQQTPPAFKRGATLCFREADNHYVETDPRKDVNITVQDTVFRVKAGDFFQNNPYVLGAMVDYVIDQAVGAGDCTNLLDTYCGSGLFALCGAKQFKQVYGVEVSSAAVKAATTNAAANSIRNVRFILGSSEAIFSVASNLSPSETVVVIDPPRRGCDDAFLSQLFAFRPRRLVYVSCDPATQARDAAAIVAQGYTMERIQPFDLFPQTRHIENVITFVLRK